MWIAELAKCIRVMICFGSIACFVPGPAWAQPNPGTEESEVAKPVGGEANGKATADNGTIACTARQALGTSRILSVGVDGGPAIGLKTYPQTLPLADREVVLTFDDGPLPGSTGSILETLQRECVLATFFLIGRNAAAHPDLVRREIGAGHSVGHHSYSHPYVTLRGLPDEAARTEIEKGIAADEQAGWGKAATADAPHVPFFRFPGFADTKPLIEWLGSRNIAVFGTDVWASDWNMMTPQAELELLLARVETAGKGIVLLHDTRPQTAAMLPEFLRELKRRGFHIVHVVPGPGKPETLAAPPGWTSETEAVLARIMPKLLARQKPNSKRLSTSPANLR